MLEKIGAPGYETLSRPHPAVIRLVAEVAARTAVPVIYEVGVGVGATTLPMAELLDGRGQIVLFSRERDVTELASDLTARGYTNVTGWGSPTKTYSGYHFELARGFCDGLLPRFDLAFLDGGHVFHLDAPAACVLKELCQPGGYIVFDDWDWCLATSPTLRPSVRRETAREYDALQIVSSHVELVCRVVMNTDRRFEFLGIENNSAVYRRVVEDRPG